MAKNMLKKSRCKKDNANAKLSQAGPQHSLSRRSKRLVHTCIILILLKKCDYTDKISV
ncbi:hypothetical protein DSUL_90013 [Desulfovibrionales bacterium]